MQLFKVENYSLTISPQAYMLVPFKAIWKRDRTRDKSVASLELAYIYYMVDARSDFQIYVDEEERDKQVRIGLGIDKKWKADKLVKEAMEFYGQFKSHAVLLLEDTRLAIDKLRNYIKEINLDKTDKSGKPIYPLNGFVNSLKEIPKLISSLDEAERLLAKEERTSEQVKGSSVPKALLEDD